MPMKRPAPADARMSVFAAPIPAGAIPTVVVPAITPAFVPIILRLGIGAVGDAVLRRPNDDPEPGLIVPLLALRQDQWRPGFDGFTVHRDAEVVLVDNREHCAVALEGHQMPDLRWFFFAFSQANRSAFACRLAGIRGKPVEAEPSSRDVAVVKSECLARHRRAICQHCRRTGNIVGAGDIHAPIHRIGGERGLEGIELLLGSGRNAGQTKRQCGDRQSQPEPHRRPAAVARYMRDRRPDCYSKCGMHSNPHAGRRGSYSRLDVESMPFYRKQSFALECTIRSCSQVRQRPREFSPIDPCLESRNGCVLSLPRRTEGKRCNIKIAVVAGWIGPGPRLYRALARASIR